MKRFTGILTLFLLLGIFLLLSVQFYAQETPLSHPRLFFDSDDIAGLQALAASSTHAEIWEPIEQFAEDMLDATPPPVSAPAAGDLEFYRNAGNQIIAMAFACVITERNDLCDNAIDYLVIYAGWTQWDEGNIRDLGHAHMLLGNALAYDWLYTRLSGTERNLVSASLALWTSRMYEASSWPSYDGDWNNWWRDSYMQNHHSINNSGMGMAALALLGEAAVPEAQTWVNYAALRFENMRDILNDIGDGTWHEGIPYQNYWMSMVTPFWDNLRRIEGVDVIPDDYLQSYATWRLYNYLPNGEFIITTGNFNWEWSNGYGPQSLLRFNAREYSNSLTQWLGTTMINQLGRSASVYQTPWQVFEFLYYDPSVPETAPLNLPKIQTFPDAESVIWRTDWTNDALIFGLDTGAYGGRSQFEAFINEQNPWIDCVESECQLNVGHNHRDANTIFVFNRRSWLVPEAVGEGNNETGEHNTLIIDGLDQYIPPSTPAVNYRTPSVFEGTDGVLETAVASPGFAYVFADATGRYSRDQEMDRVERHVVIVDSRYLVVLDDIRDVQSHDYEWVMHFENGVTVDGNWLHGTGDFNQGVDVAMLLPWPDDRAQCPGDGVNNHVPCFGDDGSPYARIRIEDDSGRTPFLNVVFPVNSSTTAPAFTVLSDTDNGASLRGTYSSGALDDIAVNYTGSSATLLPYTLDGDVASVLWAANGSISKLFTYGGSFVNSADLTGDNTLVEGVNPQTTFEAVYSGTEVHVTGTVDSDITLFAPNAASLTVNGTPALFERSGDYIVFDGTPVPDLTPTPTETPTGTPSATPSTPVANDDSYSAGEGVVLTVPAAGVLTNDTDPANNPLTAALVSEPQNGTLDLNPDGGFTYMPVTGFSGLDTFMYRAYNGFENSNTATATISIGVFVPPPGGQRIGGNMTAGTILPEFGWTPPDDGEGNIIFAEWYRIVLVNQETGQIVFDVWRPRGEVCDEITCIFILTDDILFGGLANGTYDWYVQFWSEATGFGDYLGPNTFVIDVPQSTGAQFLEPIAHLPYVQLVLAGDDVAAWYQIWIGSPAPDYEMEYMGWTRKPDSCNHALTCTLLPAAYPSSGRYELWMQVWGAGGFSPWTGPIEFDHEFEQPGRVTGLTVTQDENGQPIFSWDWQDNVSWYNIWVGTPEFDEDYFGWHWLKDLGCEDDGVCELTLTGVLNNGEYIWFLQAWGPGGFNTDGDYAPPLHSWLLGGQFTVP